MNKIRIVQIVPMLSPGGAERMVLHLVRGMNRDRYEPMVVSLMGRMDCELDRLLDELGVRVQYLGKRLGLDYRMFARIYRALRACKPDIVHTHLQVLRYVFPCLRLFKSPSALHTVHNLADREIEPGMRWVQRYALNHGVVPVAVAEEVAHSVRRTYGITDCRVIPNGIPTDAYAHPKMGSNQWREREGFGADDVLFICVARFTPQKNHELLLKAFAAGPARQQNTQLILAGEGALRPNLEKQASALGLAGRVHFLGLRSDIAEALAAADVFVLSSDWEGHPLSIMEAMAAGLPVVSTAAGGVPELVENGREGFIVPLGDLHGLAQRMQFLTSSFQARQSLGRAAARRAHENFDVSIMVRSYEDLYESILVEKRRAVRRHVVVPASAALRHPN